MGEIIREPIDRPMCPNGFLEPIHPSHRMRTRMLDAYYNEADKDADGEMPEPVDKAYRAAAYEGPYRGSNVAVPRDGRLHAEPGAHRRRVLVLPLPDLWADPASAEDFTVTSGELVEWLRAQLLVDQQNIAAILRRSPNWRVDSEPWDAGGVGVLDDKGDAVAIAIGDYAAEHIANWDPSRVLREVESKRLLVDEYDKALASVKAHPDDYGSKGWLLSTIRVLKILAAVYADRPGYQESWRPT